MMEGRNNESLEGSKPKKTRAKKGGARAPDRVPLTQEGASTEDSSADALERGMANPTATSGRKNRRGKHRDYTKMAETAASPSLLSQAFASPSARVVPTGTAEDIEMPQLGSASGFQQEQLSTRSLVVQTGRPSREATSLIALSTYHAFHGKRSTLEVGLKTTATLTIPLMAIALYKKGGENYVTVVLKKPLEGIYYIFPIFGGYINYMLGTMFVSSTAKSIKNGDELYVTGNDSRSAVIKMYAPLIGCSVAGVMLGFPYAVAAWQAASSYVVLVAGSTWIFNTIQFTFAVNEIFTNAISRLIRAFTKDDAKILAYKLRDRLDRLYNTVLKHASKEGHLIAPCLEPTAPRTEHFAEDNLRAIVDYATEQLLFQQITHAEVTPKKPYYPITIPVKGLAVVTFLGVTWAATGIFAGTLTIMDKLLPDGVAYLSSGIMNLILGLLLGNWGAETTTTIFSLFFTLMCLQCNDSDNLPALESDWADEHFSKTTKTVSALAAVTTLPTFATTVWINYIIPVGFPFYGIPLPAWFIGGAQVCAYIFIPVANAYGAIKMARAIEKYILSVWPGVPRDMRDKIAVYNGITDAKENIKMIPLDKLLLEFGKLPQDLQEHIGINIPGLPEAVAAARGVAAERGSLLGLPQPNAARNTSGFFQPSQARRRPEEGQFIDLESGIRQVDNKDHQPGCIMQ